MLRALRKVDRQLQRIQRRLKRHFGDPLARWEKKEHKKRSLWFGVKMAYYYVSTLGLFFGIVLPILLGKTPSLGLLIWFFPALVHALTGPPVWALLCLTGINPAIVSFFTALISTIIWHKVFFS